MFHMYFCVKNMLEQHIIFSLKADVPLTSPIVREWLSTMALPASPSSSVGQPLSLKYDMPPVDSPQEKREQVGEDMLEYADDDEDFKQYEIIKGGNIYGCTMHSGLNFANCEELEVIFLNIRNSMFVTNVTKVTL